MARLLARRLLVRPSVRTFSSGPSPSAPNPVAYRQLIGSLADSGRFDRAMVLAKELRTTHGSENSLDVATYDALIAAGLQDGRVDHVLALVEDMEGEGSGSGVTPRMSTYRRLVFGLCTQGRTEDALTALQKAAYNTQLQSPRADMFAAVMELVAGSQTPRYTFKLYAQMTKFKVEKDTACFNAVLAACVATGDLALAEESYVQLLASNTLRPDDMTYRLMARMYGKACTDGGHQSSARVHFHRKYSSKGENGKSRAPALDQADAVQKLSTLLNDMHVANHAIGSGSASAMIEALVLIGKSDQAVSLMERLQSPPFNADISFDALLAVIPTLMVGMGGRRGGKSKANDAQVEQQRILLEAKLERAVELSRITQPGRVGPAGGEAGAAAGGGGGHREEEQGGLLFRDGIAGPYDERAMFEVLLKALMKSGRGLRFSKPNLALATSLFQRVPGLKRGIFNIDLESRSSSPANKLDLHPVQAGVLRGLSFRLAIVSVDAALQDIVAASKAGFHPMKSLLVLTGTGYHHVSARGGQGQSLIKSAVVGWLENSSIAPEYEDNEGYIRISARNLESYATAVMASEMSANRSNAPLTFEDEDAEQERLNLAALA